MYPNAMYWSPLPSAELDDPCCWRVQNWMICDSGATRDQNSMTCGCAWNKDRYG